MIGVEEMAYSFPNGTANDFAEVTLQYTDMLDEIFAQEAKTTMWKPNPAFVRGFQNSKIGQVATITVSGFGNYTNEGYPLGKGGMTFQPYELKYDRALSIPLHNVDVMQSANIPTVSAVLAEFSRSQMIPEVDACRIARVVERAQTDAENRVKSAYTPDKSTILATVMEGLKRIEDDSGIDSGIDILFNTKYKDMLANSTDITKTKNIESKVAVLNNKVKEINDNPITYVPSARMWSKIDTKDGSNPDSSSGFEPNASAVEVVAVLTAPNTAQGVVAHNITDIFPKSERIDGALINMHMYHDCLVPLNKIPGIYVILSSVTPEARTVQSEPDAEGME